MPDYFNINRGHILGATINKYNYISINRLERLFDDRIRFSYSNLEKVNKINDLNDKYLKAILKSDKKFIDNNDYLDIHTYSDLPASSGLGSSSSFVVGTLKALHSLNEIYKSPNNLALKAIEIERKILGLKGGWQDQILCSNGGLKRIEFYSNNFDINDIGLPMKKIHKLEDSILFFYTNVQRDSSKIQEKTFTKSNIKQKHSTLKKMSEYVDDAINILHEGNNLDDMIKNFGELLNESWNLKKSLSDKISNSSIDDLYNKALKAGAYGGKITGAGGGGFLMLIVPKDKQKSVTTELNSLKPVEIKFSYSGSKIIFIN